MNTTEKNYDQFTGPQDLHKATNMLRGIVSGISCDTSVSHSEINELVNWCLLHNHLRDKHPFSEIIPVIEQVCEDGIITDDELQDVLWVCSSFVSNDNFYNLITSSIQFLEGILHGILADGELSDREIHSLKRWVDANDFLEGTYPFDEITSLLVSVLEDKKIDDSERKTLMAFFSTVIETKNSFNIHEVEYAKLREEYSVDGVCAMCPNITFENNTFCFTGSFARGQKKDLLQVTEELGGKVTNGVSAVTSYLVVGNKGNRCWAYACYGRKIEKAVSLRKEGKKVIIVNETDFWDAVDDGGNKG